MKTKERRHLKENELVHTLTAAQAFIEARRRQIGAGVVVALILGGTLAGIFILRQRNQAQGTGLLADAMVVLDAPVQPPTTPIPEEGKPTPPSTQQPGTYPTEQAKLEAAIPKLKAAADAYPASEAGITARYHLAGALADLGRHKEALEAYDDVIARAGSGLYGRMAKLGKAEVHVQLSEYEPAIAIYKELAEANDTNLPVDAILMQLARTYQAAGNSGEAQKAFSRIVHEHPGSPFSAEAGKQVQ